MPKTIFAMYYPIHFFVTRIIPKIPRIDRLYFLITKGKNRALSKAETYGRLNYCGYKIINDNIIDNKLFFVNLGGYQKDKLFELHEFGLFAGKNEKEVKKKATDTLLVNAEQQHKDDLFEVDNCLVINNIDDQYIHLTKDDKTYNLTPDWFGYNVIGS